MSPHDVLSIYGRDRTGTLMQRWRATDSEQRCPQERSWLRIPGRGLVHDGHPRYGLNLETAGDASRQAACSPGVAEVHSGTVRGCWSGTTLAPISALALLSFRESRSLSLITAVWTRRLGPDRCIGYSFRGARSSAHLARCRTGVL